MSTVQEHLHALKWSFILPPNQPFPFFVPDYLNQLVLPWDWDPKRHLAGVGEWVNRMGFWHEARWGGFDRLPVAP